MKYATLILLFVMGLTSVSCSEIKRRRKLAKGPAIQAFVFKTDYFLSDPDHQISFPAWFNDTIVRNKKMREITHKTFVKNADGDHELKIAKCFTFDDQGKLLRLDRKRYYENFVVENVTFLYTSEMDPMGYVPVKIVDSLHPKEASEYDFYLKESYNREYLVYTNSLTGDFLFCVLDPKLCGIVSVDSLFHPTPQDLIVYGKPSQRKKQFLIENLVTEKSSITFDYFKNSKELQRIERDNYPFYITKDALLSTEGRCLGFVDSTFSGGDYLNRTVRKFQFDKDLPIKLVHEGMRGGTYETFEYSYFE